MIVVLVRITSFLLILLVLMPVSYTPSLSSRTGIVLVGVYFYVWYGDGYGSRHWSDSPNTTVVDKPLIGYYSSMSETAIRWQLKLIKEMGADFLAISWWGPGGYEDQAAKVVFGYLKEYGLKAVIFVEPYLGSGHPEYYNKTFWEKTLAYIKENYIDKYPESYLYLYGKPLVMAFNPIGMKYNPSNDFDDYTIRITGNDIDNAGYQDWDYWPDYLVGKDVTVEGLRIRRDGYVVVTPRYDDYYLDRTPCIRWNIGYGRTYMDQWEWILAHRDKISIVMIATWNEYHERTMVEPHYDETASVDPYYAYNIAKHYIQKLKQASLEEQLDSYPQELAMVLGGLFIAMLLLGLASHIITRATR